MKVGSVLGKVNNLFLDTAPVIYFVEKNPVCQARVVPFFLALDQGPLAGCTSVITLAECLVQPTNLGLKAICQNFLNLIVHGNGITFKQLNHVCGQLAADFRARYGFPLPDCLHLAAASQAGCDGF